MPAFLSYLTSPHPHLPRKLLHSKPVCLLSSLFRLVLGNWCCSFPNDVACKKCLAFYRLTSFKFFFLETEKKYLIFTETNYFSKVVDQV
ncbi:hypothetical protein BO85DRAFT_116088 [Aspergillus piperis CBS 112811]|uniref:Uncharacterized protein n=1 Tax=Aspergillus piperis CBS 112811 TaxID=1448313 RepID=A0A8G1VTF9_9EURO|nr:hypothetical protein BO85DRAFT_116088 [Aspergillus piperis CBS 112811]RAH61763.1 hypothetical protein BO85DRAFT_116088 [Aspergillus piperis CBS 112811]